MPTSDRPTLQSAKVLQTAVSHLLEEAKRGAGERRFNDREAFFRPVDMAVSENGYVRKYSCFSRDISPNGIGLLHNMPVNPEQQVILTIHSPELGPVRVWSEIVWCEPCGEGWYVSGLRFLEITFSKAAAAVLGTE